MARAIELAQRMRGSWKSVQFGHFIEQIVAVAAGLSPTRRWRVTCTAGNVDEVPCTIPKRRACLVGSGQLQKWLIFDCPCNTGHRIMLNLDASRTPYWRLYTTRAQRITVSPSIDYRDGLRHCHYVLRAGRVIWSFR